MLLRARSAAVATLLAGAMASSARAQTIASTLAPDGSFDAFAGFSASAGPPFYDGFSIGLATPFTAAASGALGTIRVGAYQFVPWVSPATSVDLRLYAGASLAGATLLESFTFIPGGFPGSVTALTSALNPAITAGDAYWLAMTVTAGTLGNVSWNQSSDPAFHDYVYTLDGGTTWLPTNWHRPAYELTALASTTAPEPATLALVVTGLASLGGLRLRTRRGAPRV
jgi:hypothetical protein